MLSLKRITGAARLLLGAVALATITAPAMAAEKPNIVVIMGDDIGMWNIGAYHRGMMAGTTPNIDKLAAEGAIFTDYYAEASCTAGRSSFVTGQLPIRTGLTTVGQAGATVGMPAAAPTIATVLKDMGYATGQFGKNHLGDRNEYLPTLHGFDEYWGWLYHLDAMQDRGILFIEAGDELYTGQVIGEYNKEGDLVVNAQKAKQLTNMRASGSDRKMKIAPPLGNPALLQVWPPSTDLRTPPSAAPA